MMTEDQKADWDRLFDELVVNRADNPALPHVVSMPDDLYFAADADLADYHRKIESRHSMTMLVAVLLILLGCILGWAASAFTQPHRSGHAQPTQVNQSGTTGLLRANHRAEGRQAVL